jgi:hypothetical protein
MHTPLLKPATLMVVLAIVAGRPVAAQSGANVGTRPVEPYQLDPAYRRQDADAPKAPVLQPVETERQQDDRPFAREVEQAAKAAGVDPDLVHALIGVESAYRADAVSPKGAVGLMQLLPETALRYGVKEPSRVEDNLSAGTRHLGDLIATFGDRLDLALAAYNAGAGAVRKYGNRIPPYSETRNYVPAVLKRYQPKTKARVAQPVPGPKEYLPGTRLAPDALTRLP